MPENTHGQTSRSWAHWSTKDEPHFVYELRDRRGHLLYVGCSIKPGGRLVAHSGKPWWREVTDIKMVRYPTRDGALRVEREMIREHMPVHNVKGVPWEELARRLEDA